MDPLGFVFFIIRGILWFVFWAIAVSAVMSWLIVFNVVNFRHPVWNNLYRFLDAVTRPVLRPIQRVVPSLGGVDISPVIAGLIILGLLQFIIPRP